MDRAHGTRSTYTNHRCRCDRCRAAHMAAYRSVLAAKPTPGHVHGTVNGYSNYGCRCDRCRAANNR